LPRRAAVGRSADRARARAPRSRHRGAEAAQPLTPIRSLRRRARRRYGARTMHIPTALAVAALVGGCAQNDASSEVAGRAKMAGELVECKNSLSDAKQKLAEVQATLDKMKAAEVKQLDPIDLVARPVVEKHMEGNIPPEK